MQSTSFLLGNANLSFTGFCQEGPLQEGELAVHSMENVNRMIVADLSKDHRREGSVKFKILKFPPICFRNFSVVCGLAFISDVCPEENDLHHKSICYSRNH